MAFLWLRSPAGRAYLLERLLVALDPPAGTIEAATLDTDLWSHVELRGVAVRDDAGRTLVGAERIRVDLRLDGVPGRLLVVEKLTIDGLRAELAIGQDGLDLARVWGPPAPDDGGRYAGLGFDLRVHSVDVGAPRVRVRVGETDYGLEDARLMGAVDLDGPVVAVRDLALVAQGTTPAFGPLRLVGGVRWEPTTLWTDALAAGLGPHRVAFAGGIGRLEADAPTLGLSVTDLHVETDALPWADLGLDPLVPPVTGTFDADGAVTGLVEAPHLALSIRTPGGPLNVEGGVDTRPATLAWDARVDAGGVDLHAFLPGVPDTRLWGSLEARGTGSTWPDGIAATGNLDLRAQGLGTDGTVRARGGLALDDGVLRGKELDVRAPGAEVRGDVALRLQRGTADAEIRSARVRLAELAAYGVEGLTGEVVFRGRVRGDWSVETSASAEGTIEGTALGGPAWSLRRASGPVLASWDAAVGTLETTLAGEGLDAGGVHVEAADVQARVTASADGTGSVSGSVDARTLGVVPAAPSEAGSIRAPRLAQVRANVDVKWTPDGADGTVDAALQDVEAGALSASAGRVAATLTGPRVVLTADLFKGARTVVGLTGRLDTDARVLELTRALLAPTGGTAWSGDGPQRIRWEDGGAPEVRLALAAAGGGRLTLEGAVPVGGPVSLQAAATDLPLAALGFLDLGALEGVTGTVDLALGVDGSRTEPRVEGRLLAHDLQVPEVLDGADLAMEVASADNALRIDAIVSATDSASPGRRSDGASRPALATLRGVLPVRLGERGGVVDAAGPLDLALVLRPATGTEWNEVLAGAPMPVGAASAELRISGTPGDPRVAIVANAELPVGQAGRRVEVELDARSEGDVLGVRAVLREQKSRRAEISGTLDVAVRDAAAALLEGRSLPQDPLALVRSLTLNVVPLQLTMPTLTALAGLPPFMEGSVVGGLQVTGTPRHPRAQGALLIVDGRMGGQEVSPAMIDLSSGDAGYVVGLQLGFPNGEASPGTLDVRGLVPFDPRLADPLSVPGLALRVEGERIPFAAVGAVLPGVERAEGTLSLRGTVRGSSRAPAPDLVLEVRDAAFDLTTAAVRLEDLRFDAQLDADSLRVRDLSARTVPTDPNVRAGAAIGGADGSLSGEVRVALEAFSPTEVSGTLALDRAWLSGRPDTQLRVRAANAVLSGRVPALRLSGAATVETARVTVDESFFTGSDNPLRLDPAIRIRRGAAQDAGPSSALSGAEDTSLLPRPLQLGLDVDLDRSFFLDASMPMRAYLGAVASGFASIQLVAQMDGELRARGEDGDLSLEGSVVPVRGTATVFGKPFDIAGGTVAFTGRDYANPVLDLTAVHDAGAYGEVEVRITGSASSPSLAFSSDAYPATDDVLAILVLGRPLGEAQSNDALSLVSGLLQSQLSQAGGAAPVDLLELGLSGVRVGQRLGPDLFLAVELDVAADDEADDRVAVTLQWQLTDAWSAEVRAGSTGSVTGSLRWKRRFGGEVDVAATDAVSPSADDPAGPGAPAP